MPREHIDYRAHLEQLNRLFPDLELLSVEDVMRITGYSQSSVRRHYPISNGKISKVKLARLMCD